MGGQRFFCRFFCGFSFLAKLWVFFGVFCWFFFAGNFVGFFFMFLTNSHPNLQLFVIFWHFWILWPTHCIIFGTSLSQILIRIHENLVADEKFSPEEEVLSSRKVCTPGELLKESLFIGGFFNYCFYVFVSILFCHFFEGPHCIPPPDHCEVNCFSWPRDGVVLFCLGEVFPPNT